MWIRAFVAYIGFILGVLAEDEDLVIRANEGQRLEINVEFPNNPNPSQCAYMNKFGTIMEDDEYQTMIENGRCKLIIAHVSFKRDNGILIGSVSNKEHRRMQLIVSTCGTRAFDIDTVEDRISGGIDAVRGAWPWVVSIQLNYNGVLINACGGALINSQWIVTAAHCIAIPNQPAEQWSISLGDLNREIEEDGEIKIPVTEYIVHEGFSLEPKILNDIALMKLKDPVDFASNDFINTICLPQKNIPYEQYTCYATGWGQINFEEEQTPILQQVNIPIVDQKLCESYYASSSDRVVNDDYLCAGQGTKGGCAGDSGSPFICEVDGQWHLVGVTSGGERGCSVPEYPGIYARVSSYIDWIAEKIN